MSIFISGLIQIFHTFHYKLTFFKTPNLDLPGNIAAVDKRKIYMFHFGNQRQNMSGLPVSSSNNQMTAPGRK